MENHVGTVLQNQPAVEFGLMKHECVQKFPCCLLIENWWLLPFSFPLGTFKRRYPDLLKYATNSCNHWDSML